jgi:putative hydrolase of the HAD superfamily
MWRGCLIEVLDEHDHRAEDFADGLRDGFPWHTPDVPHPELATPDAWWAPIELLLARAYERLGYSGDRAMVLARLARDRYVDPAHGWALFDDTRPALEGLKGDGWRHVILSNHVPELAAIVAALGLDDLVDAIVNSALTGYEKPHPEAFAAARRAAGEPRELWMVGDNPTADVAGAKAAGIPALLARGDRAGLTEIAERISRSAAEAR